MALALKGPEGEGSESEDNVREASGGLREGRRWPALGRL